MRPVPHTTVVTCLRHSRIIADARTLVQVQTTCSVFKDKQQIKTLRVFICCLLQKGNRLSLTCALNPEAALVQYQRVSCVRENNSGYCWHESTYVCTRAYC